MICFCSLPHLAQMVIIILTWLALLGQLVLSVYRFFYHRRTPYVLLDGALLCVLLSLICFLVKYNQGLILSDFHLPLFALIIILTGAFIYSAVCFCYEIRHSKCEINEWSVKEAIDDLPLGLLFSDGDGNIVLMNRKMTQLSYYIMGRLASNLDDLTRELSNCDGSGVQAMPDVADCYRFADGRIYRFCRSKLNDEKLSGYVQLVAYDETQLYEGNVRLRKNNAELEQVNQRLREMFARMEDDVREKESLDLKIWLHDTLGSSLLTIQDVKNSDSKQTDFKLKSLQNAVGMLSANRPTANDTLEKARLDAEKLGVRVLLKGDTVNNAAVEQIISVAVRECVTNCIRHAKGNEVYACVNLTDNACIISITNNGEQPKSKITEGSGLSSLRRSVEASGGEMKVSFSPRFELKLNLPREVNNSL